MAEVMILLVVCVGVGVYRRRGRWEWSRRSLADAVGGLGRRTDRLVARGRRGLPGVLGQLSADLRALGDDLLGLLHPGARRRIEHRARALMARRPSPSVAPTTRLAPAGRPAAGAFEGLQQSYLNGSITLERYVQEAERLRAGDQVYRHRGPVVTEGVEASGWQGANPTA